MSSLKCLTSLSNLAKRLVTYTIYVRNVNKKPTLHIINSIVTTDTYTVISLLDITKTSSTTTPLTLRPIRAVITSSSILLALTLMLR